MKRFLMILSFVTALVLTLLISGAEPYEKYEIHENVKAENSECDHEYPNGGEYEIIPASCTRKGLKYRVCAICGANDIVELPKDPDNHASNPQNNLVYEKRPTCSEGGIGYYVCTSCNKVAETVELPIDPEAHVKDGDFVVLEKETCRKNGTMAYKCKHCEAYFNHQTIPSDPLAHVMNDSSKWVITVMPTCAEDGVVEGYCDECYNVTVTKKVPATGEHTADDEWYIVTDETCSSDGVKAHKCTVCSQPVDETPIPKDPGKHTYSDKFTVDVASTCISQGVESRHCIYCDDRIEQTVIPVDEMAHSYNNEWIVTTEPTCSQPGYRHRICQLCSEKSISTIIPKTEHTYPEEYEVIQESADGKSLQVKYICTVCGAEYITIVTNGNNTDNGNNGGNADTETKKHIIEPVENADVKVDHDKMYISDVAKDMKVKDFYRLFKNSSVFAVYNTKGVQVNDEEYIGTGMRLNYKSAEGYVTNYYVSVTGDMDSNGKITAADARKILRVSAKIESLNGIYSLAADVNHDGNITAADARKTLRVSANIEKI